MGESMISGLIPLGSSLILILTHVYVILDTIRGTHHNRRLHRA